MPEPIGEKKTLRAQLRERLVRIDSAALRARSASAAHRLVETAEFRRAQAVMIFLPLAYEVDTRPIALRAWQDAKTVTIPLVSYQQKHMLPVEIRSLDEPMETDRYGVRVPPVREPHPVDLIDLVVVPGLGFDPVGHRIGRGAGFYDRFLSQRAFRGVACGLTLEEQVVGAVPIHAHDVRLDMLVTDERVLRFRGGGASGRRRPEASPPGRRQ